MKKASRFKLVLLTLALVVTGCIFATVFAGIGSDVVAEAETTYTDTLLYITDFGYGSLYNGSSSGYHCSYYGTITRTSGQSSVDLTAYKSNFESWGYNNLKFAGLAYCSSSGSLWWSDGQFYNYTMYCDANGNLVNSNISGKSLVPIFENMRRAQIYCYPYSSTSIYFYFSSGYTKNIDYTGLKTKINNYYSSGSLFYGLDVIGLATSLTYDNNGYSDNMYGWEYGDIISDENGDTVQGSSFVDNEGYLYQSSYDYNTKFYVMFKVPRPTIDIDGIDENNSFERTMSTYLEWEGGSYTSKNVYALYFYDEDNSATLCDISVTVDGVELDESNYRLQSTDFSRKVDDNWRYYEGTVLYIVMSAITGECKVTGMLDEKTFVYNIINYEDQTGYKVYGNTESGYQYLLNSKSNYTYFNSYDARICRDARYRVYDEDGDYNYYYHDAKYIFGSDNNGDGIINGKDEVVYFDEICFDGEGNCINIVSGGIFLYRDTDSTSSDNFSTCDSIAFDNFYLESDTDIFIDAYDCELYLGNMTVNIPDNKKIILFTEDMAIVYGHYGDNYYQSTTIYVLTGSYEAIGDVILGYEESHEIEAGFTLDIGDDYILLGQSPIKEVGEYSDHYQLMTGTMTLRTRDDDDEIIEWYAVFNSNHKYALEVSADGDYMVVVLGKHTVTYYDVIKGEVADYTGSAMPTIFMDSDGVELDIPTKDNFEFDGWYLDKECTNQIYLIEAGTCKNQTLYAKWTRTGFGYKQSYGYSSTYNSEVGTTLNVEITEPIEVTYQWFKNGKSAENKLIGETKSKLNIQDITDTGVYFCYITYDDGETVLSSWTDAMIVSISPENNNDWIRILVYCLVAAVIIITIIVIVLIVTKKNKKDVEVIPEGPFTIENMAKHDAILVSSIVTQIGDALSKYLITSATTKENEEKINEAIDHMFDNFDVNDFVEHTEKNDAPVDETPVDEAPSASASDDVIIMTAPQPADATTDVNEEPQSTDTENVEIEQESATNDADIQDK